MREETLEADFSPALILRTHWEHKCPPEEKHKPQIGKRISLYKEFFLRKFSLNHSMQAPFRNRGAPHQAPPVYGVSQARILEWVAMSSSKGSSRPRDRTRISGLLHRQAGS